MFCPKCGRENNEIAKYCVSCGNSLLIDNKSVNKVSNEDISASNKNHIPEDLCFIEKSTYGIFKINPDEIDIKYSATGLGAKKSIIIKYNDISEIDLIINAIPVAVKDLEIKTSNGEKYHFYIKKSNLNKWKNLVEYLKNTSFGEFELESEDFEKKLIIPEQIRFQEENNYGFYMAGEDALGIQIKSPRKKYVIEYGDIEKIELLNSKVKDFKEILIKTNNLKEIRIKANESNQKWEYLIDYLNDKKIQNYSSNAEMLNINSYKNNEAKENPVEIVLRKTLKTVLIVDLILLYPMYEIGGGELGLTIACLIGASIPTFIFAFKYHLGKYAAIEINKRNKEIDKKYIYGTRYFNDYYLGVIDQKFDNSIEVFYSLDLSEGKNIKYAELIDAEVVESDSTKIGPESAMYDAGFLTNTKRVQNYYGEYKEVINYCNYLYVRITYKNYKDEIRTTDIELINYQIDKTDLTYKTNYSLANRIVSLIQKIISEEN